MAVLAGVLRAAALAGGRGLRLAEVRADGDDGLPDRWRRTVFGERLQESRPATVLSVPVDPVRVLGDYHRTALVAFHSRRQCQASEGPGELFHRVFAWL